MTFKIYIFNLETHYLSSHPQTLHANHATRRRTAVFSTAPSLPVAVNHTATEREASTANTLGASPSNRTSNATNSTPLKSPLLSHCDDS